MINDERQPSRWRSSISPATHFEGQSTAGTPVTLAR